MPIITSSSYRPPAWLINGHMQTIYPSLFRKAPSLPFTRTTLTLPCSDIVDVDWIFPITSAKTIIIFSHGMEGNSQRKYICGMAKLFTDQGYAIASRNCRGCSGTMNLLAPMYHSGQTEDLHTVIAECIRQGFANIVLIGFSMGGNQTLKYLGEEPQSVPEQVRCAIVFSVPTDLDGCARTLDAWHNTLYVENFLHTLRQKVRQKHVQFPDAYPLQGLEKIRTLEQFDNRYTAPIFGYSCAEDYWKHASSLPFLGNIQVPTLMVNAKNDPFLSASCYPYTIAQYNPHLFLETPKQGGHVGFVPHKPDMFYWSDKRALAFVKEMGL